MDMKAFTIEEVRGGLRIFRLRRVTAIPKYSNMSPPKKKRTASASSTDSRAQETPRSCGKLQTICHPH